METCHECPVQYPWLGDAEGTGIPGRDNYIFNSNDENAADETEPEETVNRRRK